jgi:hypothetical protein
MRGAILYEYSGIMRDTLTKAGHDVISVDLLPTEQPGKHWQGDVWKFLKLHPAEAFDFIIAHPPCTRLCNSGVLRLYVNGKKSNGVDMQRWADMEKAAKEFKRLTKLKCKRVIIENPVMHGYAAKIIGMKPTQTIQPYEHGEDASKRTALWIIGCDKVKPGRYYPPRMVNGLKRWGNQTDSGQNRLGPSETRGKDRAKTYPGVAEAISKIII